MRTKNKNSAIGMFCIILVLFVVLITLITAVNAQGTENIKDNLYRISQYDITIDVDQNRTCTITEELEVRFDVYSAGITRRIPTSNYIVREDGSIDYVLAEMTNFHMISNGASENKIYDSYQSKGYYVFELGYSGKMDQTIHNYKYQYTYALGSDEVADYDEFYFNIIGTEWDCEIHNATFTVNLPKEFEPDLASNIGATYGTYGETHTLDTYTGGSISATKINGGVVIEGSIDFLDAFKGLTLRAEMEEGYFAYTPNYTSIYYLVGVVVVSALLIVFAYVLWRKYGKDYDIVSPVTFYPPKDCTIADMELHYKEEVSTKSVVAMIVNLANSGYVKIEQVDEKSKEFIITKLKNYAGTNKQESKLMNSLFLRVDKINTKDLGKVLDNYTDELFNQYNNDVSHSKVIEWIGLKKANLVIIPTMICMALLTVLPLMYINVISSWLLPALIVGFISGALMNAMLGVKDRASLRSKITLLVAVVLIYYGVMLYMGISIKWWLSLFVILGCVAYIILTIFVLLMKRRTKASCKLYGEILAFKDFLESVEKEKLEELVTENPTYFFDILPYTFVLEISDKWIEKMNYLHIETPDWYSSSFASNRFFYSMTVFNHAMTKSVDNIQSGYSRLVAARHAASLSGGGGSGGHSGGHSHSGGGRSGGGFGGGGGGRR